MPLKAIPTCVIVLKKPFSRVSSGYFQKVGLGASMKDRHRKKKKTRSRVNIANINASPLNNGGEQLYEKGTKAQKIRSQIKQLR